MPLLTLATTASSNPMGAQAYAAAIRMRAASALREHRSDWRIADVVARSLRSPLPGNRRLPMGWLSSSSPVARRALGRAVYPHKSMVHRMDLILPPPPGPDVITLHDMVAWDFADESDPVSAAPQELRVADAVICVSQFTADTAAERLGLTNTVVIPNGVSQDYFTADPLSSDQQQEMGLRSPYLLYAGGSARRKNLAGLAEAWRRVAPLRPDWQLALSGAVSDERLRLFQGAPRVAHLGRVPDEVMPRLMSGAGAAVVPSLYEGFGLPALEAMAAGVPLVVSNRSSLPEVVGQCGVLVEPSPEGLAEGIEQVTSQDPDLQHHVRAGRSRASQFSWERSAAGHAEVWTRFA